MSSTGPRVAIVTGGATGIGAACCRALAAEGFRIGIHHRGSVDRARALAAALPDAFLLQGDLSVSEDVERIVAEIRSTAGRVDVLVNNAGLARDGAMATLKLSDYDRVLEVTRGTWLLTKLVMRRMMLAARSGRIITISSVVGHTGNPGQVPYTMAKAALDSMTRSLAQELAGRGILVNSVAPGFIDTEMTAKLPSAAREAILARVPLGRMGDAEEVADVVAFLATRGTYLHGTVIHVNGGLFGG